MSSAALPPRANPDLFGHDRAVRALVCAAGSGRLPHAWLLSGPRGIGKATLAFRFARALLAGRIEDDLALPSDHSAFRQVARGAHPDLHLLELARDRGDRLKSEIPVDAVRAAAQALRATAAAGGWRVLIVDGAEHMNRNAANALLKLLEEPPDGVVLLLVTHRPGRLAATVRSRTAMLRLQPLAPAELAAALARLAPDLGPAEALHLSALARGSPGRALLLRAIDWPALHGRILDALIATPEQTLPRLTLADELARLADRHGFGLIAELLQDVLQRAIMADLDRGEAAGLAIGEAERLRRLVAGRPLDRMCALWDNLARLAGRVDGLNLDRTHALVDLLAALRAGGGAPSEAGAHR